MDGLILKRHQPVRRCTMRNSGGLTSQHSQQSSDEWEEERGGGGGASTSESVCTPMCETGKGRREKECALVSKMEESMIHCHKQQPGSRTGSPYVTSRVSRAARGIFVRY
jgi:hypothetical protein